MTGKEIKAWMKKKGITKTTLKKILNLTPNQVDELLEKGTRNPRWLRNIRWMKSNEKVDISSELRVLQDKYSFSQKELALFLGMLPDRLERALKGAHVSADIARYIRLVLNSEKNFKTVFERDFK